MLFRLFYNNRPAGNKLYLTYEEARSAARKLIRRRFYLDSYLWASRSNPAINDYGYKIRPVQVTA